MTDTAMATPEELDSLVESLVKSSAKSMDALSASFSEKDREIRHEIATILWVISPNPENMESEPGKSPSDLQKAALLIDGMRRKGWDFSKSEGPYRSPFDKFDD